jgi:hypothetical protein
MKSKKMNITISQPCMEDWQKMTPEKQGKFCDTCAKSVIDFSQQSMADIKTYFQENQGQKVCGRFSKVQLDLINTQTPKASPSWKTLLATFAGFLAVGSLNSCDIPSTQAASSYHQPYEKEPLEDGKYAFYIQSASSKTALDLVKITFPAYEKAFYTDAKGKVVLNLSFITDATTTIEISKEGFQTKSFELNRSIKRYDIALQKEAEQIKVMGDVDISYEEDECNYVKGKVSVEKKK